ncbi:MAG: NADH dehydrogenase ubiquinone Fe-S protein 4 [Alphaproteobacteria bacterium]|jgi:hypothetical protein|nr:ETC complex I subunit [Alphaproteobacteria bacterium]
MSFDVRIYQPAKSAMQSGRGKASFWVIEFLNLASIGEDPLMGWQKTTAPFKTKKITFSDRASALAYAQKNGLSYRLEEPHRETITPKQYGHHFRANKPL